jgi:hypothetical protein
MGRIKRRSYLLILFALIFMIACKKDGVKLPSGTALVKTSTEGTTTAAYFYDNLNRISKITFSSSVSPASFETYTYFLDTIYYYRSNFYPAYNITHTLPDGTPVIRQYNGTYVLNAAGLFEGNYYNKLFTSVIIDGDDDYSYSYTAAGFIKTESYAVTDFSYTDTLINDGKNYTAKHGVTNSLAGSFSTATTYDYYTDRINTIGNTNFGKLFSGRSSENLIKGEVTVFKSTDTAVHPDFTETKTYSYTFDNQQRVTSKTTVTTSTLYSAPVVSTATFTYY